MEKILSVNRIGGSPSPHKDDNDASAPVSTSAAMKQYKWSNLVEKIMCGIGEIKSYEHFGLPEMLHQCVISPGRKSIIGGTGIAPGGQFPEKGKSLPSSCRYSAKGS